MTSRLFRFSLKESADIPSKAKLFPDKIKHHQRHNSISISNFAQKIQTKKLSIKGTSLFKVNSAEIEKLASYGTNHKEEGKEINVNKKDSKEAKKRLTLIESCDKANELFGTKDKLVRKRKSAFSVKKRINSHRFSSPDGLNLVNKKYKNISQREKEIVIIRKDSQISNIIEHSLELPIDLRFQLSKPNLSIVPPSYNVEGNYTDYINSVAKSIKNFLNFEYEDIFSESNSRKVKYFYYSPPMIIEDEPRKKLLLLDLDETLIHSEFRTNENCEILETIMKNSKCYVKTFSFSDQSYTYVLDVYFRPFLKSFLREISQYFEIGIFTAGTKYYADTILDYIDPNNEYFLFRLYRDACIPIQNRLYIKDLRIIKNYDPCNVILMDNSLYSFMNQPSNGMLVNSFYTNHKDIQLITAKDFLLNHIYSSDDVRKVCEKWYHFTELFNKDNNNKCN